MKKLLLLTLSMAMSLASYGVSIDASSTGNWSGYMTWFDVNPDGTAGGYQNGSGWGVGDLAVTHSGDSGTFGPNIQTYNASDAYWSNGSGDGNKFMEATYKMEANTPDNTAWNGQTLTFAGTIDAFDLDSRYETVAFIKTLDSANGWATVQNEQVAITSTGDFSISLDVNEGSQFVAQIGMTMRGINANPATDWGSVSFSGLTASAVPEPSTYALIAGFAAFIFVAIRRRK